MSTEFLRAQVSFEDDAFADFQQNVAKETQRYDLLRTMVGAFATLEEGIEQFHEAWPHLFPNGAEAPLGSKPPMTRSELAQLFIKNDMEQMRSAVPSDGVLRLGGRYVEVDPIIRRAETEKQPPWSGRQHPYLVAIVEPYNVAVLEGIVSTKKGQRSFVIPIDAAKQEQKALLRYGTGSPAKDMRSVVIQDILRHGGISIA